MEKTEKFSFRFYFRALTSIIREPGIFFRDLPPDMGLKLPAGFLCVSSFIHVAFGLAINMPSRPILLGGVFFINAVGMVFIAAALGYMLTVMFMKKRVPFAFFFSVYAFSSGVTLLASWLPFFIWLTEPWKWWLIGTGMIKAFGFRWTQAVLVIVVSFAVIALFFLSVSPFVFPK